VNVVCQRLIGPVANRLHSITTAAAQMPRLQVQLVDSISPHKTVSLMRIELSHLCLLHYERPNKCHAVDHLVAHTVAVCRVR
jgi:hypothetical protein